MDHVLRSARRGPCATFMHNAYASLMHPMDIYTPQGEERPEAERRLERLSCCTLDELKASSFPVVGSD